LSRTASVELPTGPGVMTKVPCPSLLIGLAVKDDTLLKAVDRPLEHAKIPVVKTQADGTPVSSVNLPLPAPFPFQPSYAIYSNYFLLGSTSAVVADAIKAAKHGDGLVAAPEFKKAFQGVSMVNNGVFYMSPRFMKVIMDIQSAAMPPTAGEDGPQAMFREMLGAGAETPTAFVYQNLKGGVLTTGTSSSGGKDLVGSVLVVPVAMMAAIALPSFAKARSTSQGNACINNLRQLDAAKEQWALAERKADGDEVSIPGVLEYIKGNKMPVCPQGGKYTLNPIGKDPVCSVPGHQLQQVAPDGE
jgi:hypothetical protein